MNNQNNKPDYQNETTKRKIPFKRSFFILLALAGIITGMVFSTRYVFDNSKFGNLYGDGIRVTVKIDNINENGNPSNVAVTDAELTKAENSIYSRISNLGLGKPSILTNEENKNYTFSITQPNVDDEDGAVKYASELTSKSRLTFYSVDDVPLFDGTSYNSAKRKDPVTGPGIIQKIIKSDSAKYTQKRVDSRLLNTVAFEYKNSAAKSGYSDALKGLAGGDPNKGENRMVAWIDRDGLKNLAETLYKKEWDAAGNNLYNFAHVSKDGEMTQTLKTSPFNANDYLIADGNVGKDTGNDTAPTNEVTINNSFQPNVAKAFADRINYGSSSYKLSQVGRYSFVAAPFGKTAMNRLLISSVIIISLIIIFLIGRYGIFGFVTALGFTLFISLLMLIFTVFQGHFTLLTIGAIIFGILLMLDASVVTYEELKQQLYEGKSIGRSINAANKHSAPTFFDSSFITLGMSFIVFYLGANYLPGFSVAIVISIILTILISYLFIRGITIGIVKSGLLDKRSYLIGNYSNRQEKYLNHQEKLSNINYSRGSKFALIGSATTMVAAIVVLIVTAIMSGSIWGGLNSNINLTGGKQITVKSIFNDPSIDHGQDQINPKLDSQTLSSIYAIEAKYDSNIVQSYKLYEGENKGDDKVQGVVMTFKNNFNTEPVFQLLNNIQLPSPASTTYKIGVTNTSFQNKVDKKLLGKTLIALAITFLFIVIYVLLRFRWTFSLALLIALLHDGLIVTSIFIITRLPFSSFFAAALLLVLFYSAFNKILIFNEMRRNIKNNKITSTYEFKPIIHKALGGAFYRNIIMFTIFTAIGVILAVIPNSSDLTFSLSIIIGAIASTMSIYLVFPYFWVKIEKLRFNMINKHKKNKLWNVDSDEEQTFENINEIQEI